MHCFRLFTLLAACALLSGCGPQVSREELGEVHFAVPKVEGTGSPYPLPDFSQPPEESAAKD